MGSKYTSSVYVTYILLLSQNGHFLGVSLKLISGLLIVSSWLTAEADRLDISVAELLRRLIQAAREG